MKHWKYICAALVATLCAAFAHAQTAANVLSVPDMKVKAGTEARLPIVLENADEVVAMQFDLILPAGITTTSGGVKLTDRAKGTHTVTGRMMDASACRVVVISSANKAVKGNSGDIVYLDVNIPSSLTERETYKVQLKNVVISNLEGEDVPTSLSLGDITVASRPDLEISGLTTSATTVRPGDNVPLSWTVTNVGELPTQAGWKEQISLVAVDGGSKLLATYSQPQTLAPLGKTTRNVTVKIPDIPTVDGPCVFVVKLVPEPAAGEPAAALINNEMMTQTVVVDKTLYLNIVSSIDEDHYHPNGLYGSVKRSGNRQDSETFRLAVTPTDARIKFPASVTIPAGASSASFEYYVLNNSTLDNDSIFTVTLTGGDYDKVTRTMKVHDNELPRLFLSLDRTSLTEGESLTASVRAERAPKSDLAVRVYAAGNSSRFTIPSGLVIPAGQSTVTLKVTARDNADPQLDETFRLYASAPGHVAQSAEVRILDNDIPAISLGVDPSIFGEGNDSTAIKGRVVRTTNTDKHVKVQLTANRSGQLRFPSQVTMEPGVESVEFDITPVDNGTVDYSRDVVLTGAVYLEANGVKAPASTPGYAQAMVRVLDDDGKTLTLSADRSVWAEGSGNYLTVRRNTTSSEGALTVTLSSNDDSRFDYAKTLTIKAGETSAKTLVSVKRNTVDDDDTEVIFTAVADNYNEGACIVGVSDKSIADATVALRIPAGKVEIKDPFEAVATVHNAGYLTIPAGAEVKVYAASGALEGTGKIATAIEPGESASVSIPLTALVEVGSKGYYATVNEARSFQEMSYSNNRSNTATLSTTPGFTTTLEADKSLCRPDETVVISGKASGNHAAGATVRVTITGAAGYSRTIDTDCGLDGAFEVEWTPGSSAAGRYSITSAHPRTTPGAEQASVEVYGLRLSSRNAEKFDLEEGTSRTFDIKVYNPGPALTGLKAEVVEAPAGCTVTLGNASIASLASGATATIPMRVSGTVPSASTDFEQIYVTISSNEGPKVSTLHSARCRYHKANLTVNPATLNLTMLKGREREIQVEITNTGLRESGEVRWSAKEWVTGVSPIASIQPGETVTATLTLKAPESSVLDRAYAPSLLSFTCANGNGASMKLGVTVVSNEKGSLVVTASDDKTYNHPDHPHLAGAYVTVTKTATGARAAEGYTDADGLFPVESLTEGYYRVTVTAPLHESFSKSVLVNPGMENAVEAMLFLQPVDPPKPGPENPKDDPEKPEDPKPEIPDPIIEEYYAPVLVVTLPSARPALNMIIPVKVQNQGNVAAGRTTMSFRVPEGYEMEIVDQPLLGLLAPKASATFSVILRATDPDADPLEDCFAYEATASARYLCGPYTNTITETASRSWGGCGSSILPPEEEQEHGGQDNGLTLTIPTVGQFVVDGTTNVVALQLTGANVMAGQNLPAYLTVYNRSKHAIDNVRFELCILDSEGNRVEEDGLFDIDVKSLYALSGDKALDAGWSVNAYSNGVATIGITPALEAALEKAELYSIGASMYYTDPITGNTVKVALAQLPLSVTPMARLDVTYFLERDIYGDDRSTPYVVEASVPAEFALMIANTGNGASPLLGVTLPKPGVRDNSTQDPMDFSFVAARLDGSPVSSAAASSISTQVGRIAPKSASYLEWWMKSTHTGRFDDYDAAKVRFELDGYDPRMIGDVHVRELTHSVVAGKDGSRIVKGFLVNDVDDDESLPDHIYLTDNTVEEVSAPASATVTRVSGGEYTLRVAPGKSGWNYGSVNDPTAGRQKLESVTCITDGRTIDPANFWQTDRSMPDGVTPIRDYRLHFADNFGEGAKEYRLTFSYTPVKTLDVEGFEGLTGASIETEQVESLKVKFNKDVNVPTFTAATLALTCQAKEVDTDQVTITPVSDREFLIDLSALTGADGCYILSVDTRKIVDAEGFAGDEVRFAEWLQFLGGNVPVTVLAEPEEGGVVAPETGEHAYGRKLTLTAEAAEGYDFSHWTSGGEIVSRETELSVFPVDSVAYTAHFAPRKYYVEVRHEGGDLEGQGSGYYSHGDQLSLKVKAQTGWSFDGWRLNGEPLSTSKTFSHKVEAEGLIEACFTSRNAEVIVEVPQGWSWITPTFSEMTLSSPEGYLSGVMDHVIRMTHAEGEFARDDNGAFVSTMPTFTAASSYRLHMSEDDVIAHTGRIHLNNAMRVYLDEGWTWLGYVPQVEMTIEDAFSDFMPDEDDIVKSKSGFATFSGGKWHGDLTSLTPSEGYMYWSGSYKHFHYPNNHMGRAVSKDGPRMAPLAGMDVDTHRYADNATMIAQLHNGNVALPADSYTIAAFVDDECRGVGQAVDGKIFLTVQGDENDGLVSLRAINNYTHEVKPITESFNFAVGKSGTFAEPVALHLNESTGIDSNVVTDRTWTISPNPVRSVLYITGDVEAVETVGVFAISGLAVTPLTRYDAESGLDVSALVPGHYILAINTTDGTVYRRFIKAN